MPLPRASATLAGVAIITVIIIVAPLFTEPGYSMVSNPISQLAAQETRNAWLMRIGLCALGIGPGIDALRRLRTQPIRTVFLMIFAVAMLFTAWWSARPIDPEITFDAEEDKLHALAAMVAGYAFSAGALCFAATDRGIWRRLASVAAAAAASIIPVFMFLHPDVMGLLQRFMLATCFIWLVYFLPPSAPRAGQ
jgi:hypothetical membrane protein